MKRANAFHATTALGYQADNADQSHDSKYTLTLNHYGQYFPDPLETEGRDCWFHLDLSRMHESVGKDDNTNFNFYADNGYDINLHLSFRRYDQRLHIAQWFSGKWHEWGYLDFSDIFHNQSGGNIPFQVDYSTDEYDWKTYNLGTYIIEGGNIQSGGSCCVNVQPLSPTNYVNYKGPDNAMFARDVSVDYILVE